MGPAALSQDPGRQPQLVLRKSGEEEGQEEGEAEDLEECVSNRVPEVGLEEQAQRLVPIWKTGALIFKKIIIIY